MLIGRVGNFLRAGGTPLVSFALTLGIVTGLLASQLATSRRERDLTRQIHDESQRLLAEARLRADESGDSLEAAVSAPIDSIGDRPYIVVSIADHRLWLKQKETTIFATRVATGSGRILSQTGRRKWKFETPRGRLVVLNKESDPAWVPPDWHYVEVAHKKKVRMQQIDRNSPLLLSDSSVIAVAGAEIVRRYPDGREAVLEGGEGRELIIDGKVIVPPIGTNQRRFAGVVGTHRLNLGDGYALHGTDVPTSIGTSVSHGCVRLRNEDIETLFRLVPVGTPVYIY
ncbi:MAG: hypothetical protein MNPFHGCM_00768 [Gemmatimonadaceae bacterium]|nr:hypothetical protein [Gemmatimonadaceae bacterium]